MDESEYYKKSLDELDRMRLVVEESIGQCGDNASLMASVPGQKLIKRLAFDLEAIRKKYAGIKGGPDDQLANLHRLQGREHQLIEELANLSSAAQTMRELGIQLERISFVVAEKKNEKPTR